MHLAPADHETTTASAANMLMSTPSITPPVTLPKRITTALAFLSGCIALLMTGFGIIVPVFPLRLEALGLGAETLALMEGAFGLGMFLFSTPIGTLADRIGRKPIVLISLSGFIVTNLVLATVNIPLVFILIRFVEGVSISGLMPASMAMMGDTVPREKRGRWIGFITAAQAAGFALGPGIGGFLYQAWGFSSAFLILGILLYSALNVGMLLLHQYALLIGAATVTGIGNALLIPALSTIYLGATTEQNRSQVMGIRGTAISLGILLGPLTQALASPWITPQMTFAIGIALSLVITLVAFVVLKR